MSIHLSAADVARFKEKLELLRDRLCSSAKQTQNAQDHQNLKGESATSSEESPDFRLLGQDAKILRQIKRALEKIEENTYGICDLSGEAISLARLEAVPYAITTVKAQEKLEKGLY